MAGKTATDRSDFKSVAYELFILLISVVSIVNLAIGVLSLSLVRVSGPTGDVVLLMDVAITPLLLGDFLYRLFTSHPRRRYFVRGYGWLDLLAVVPVLRLLRIVRIVQVVRWLRRKGAWQVGEELAEQRAMATFLFTIFLTFVVLEIAGASIFNAESADPNANIRTAGDALWWGLVTITTVGYGDRVPVTPEGRVIGVFLLFAGIALFSVLTGFIANVFLSPRRRRLRRGQVEGPRSSIAALHALLDEQDRQSEQIRQRLGELERSLAKRDED